MPTDFQTVTVSKPMLWAGRIISALAVLFFLFDGILKLFKPPIVVTSTRELGYSESVILPLGTVLILCTLIYVIPRASVLGAILLTGYLGGAAATHVRVGAGAFPIVFPIIFGVLVWGGVYLRDARLRALIPLRQES